jgi:hypothetical protein
MADSLRPGYPISSYATDGDSHRNISRIPWFMSSGHNGTYIPTFTPDIGTSATFLTNDAATNSGYSYVYGEEDPFWSSSSYSGGFYVQKPYTVSTIEFNYKITGGTGYWMPCPIFRSISYVWENNTSGDNNFIPKRIGLVLKNWRTDEEKTFGYDGGRTKNPETGHWTYWNSTISKVQSVRDLGPDWFVYGVIFSFRSDGSSEAKSAGGGVTDFRLGYDSGLDISKYKMFLQQKQSWSDLKGMMTSGIVRYP